MIRARSALARMRREDAFTLIEVMITASLIVTVSLGVMSAVDSASIRSGSNQSRSIAANLAEEDVERMRGLKVNEISNLRETTTRTVEGVTYTIKSRADWVDDQTGAQSCQAGQATTDYLSVNSTVTWPKMNNVKPVTADSIVTPPNGTFGPNDGSLAIKVLDSQGKGVSNLSVNINGPENHTDLTNADGCVMWGFLQVGQYTASFNRGGWVDPNGVTNVSKQVDVAGMQTSVWSFDYDVAASLDVIVDTKVPGQPPQGASTDNVSIGHSGLQAPQFRTYNTASDPSSPTLGSIYPFASSYSVFSGNCTGANPSQYFATLTPGGSGTLTVREPALDITVTRNGNDQANASLVFIQKSAGCSGIFRTQGTVVTQANGKLDYNVNNPSTYWDPGIPYGTYDICASWQNRYATITNRANTDPNGSSYTVNLPTNPGGTPCP